ncbi:7018_t:CDS:2, partial [Funneliformis geosporum]
MNINVYYLEFLQNNINNQVQLLLDHFQRNNTNNIIPEESDDIILEEDDDNIKETAEPQSDRELARNWENEQVSQIHFHQQTFLGYESIHGTVNGTITDEMFIAESKKEMSVMIKLKDEDRQIFFSVIHSSPNITLEPQGHKNDCPEEDLEENLLQENPEAVFD